PADETRVDRPEHRHRRDGILERQSDRHEAAFGRQRRRLAALMKPRDAEHDGEARDQDVDGDAAHHLVAALGDAGIAVDQRHHHRGRDARREADDGDMRDRAGGGGGEGGGEHLALEPDIDDARAFGEQPRHRAEDQRRRDADGRAQSQEGDEISVFHHALAVAAKTRSKNGRLKFASAPENRMIRPWMTTIISGVIAGISNASSAPPWLKMPNSRPASTTPTGWLRPISATAMPVKP